jgi:hypothetical protein
LEATALLSHSEPTVITSTSGRVRAIFPPGVHDAPLRAEIVEGLASARVADHRSLYSFSLFGYTTDDIPVTDLASEVTLEIDTPSEGPSALSASDTVTPLLQVYDVSSSTWQQLPTVWDPHTGSVSASSSQIGTFALVVRAHTIYLPAICRSIQ